MWNKILQLLLVQLLVSTLGFSQTLMVEKAYQYLKSGELLKGLEAIDLAAENEYTTNDAKTWYIKAYICKELYKSQPEQNNQYREQAILAVKQCLKLDSSQRFSEDGKAIVSFIQMSYLNEAIQWLNAANFENALSSMRLLVDDTLSAYYAEANYYSGYALLMLEKPAEAKQFLENAQLAGYQDPLLYDALSNYYLERKNYDKAISLLIAGKLLFPTDKKLLITELNLLMELQEYENAEKQVEKYLKVYSNDVEVMLLAGTVYDKLFQQEKAQTSIYFQKRKDIYQLVLSQQPDNLTANYNLGITLYNQAVKLINQQAESYELDIFEFNKMLEKCTDLFKESLPYIRKAHELMPENVSTLKALQGIYYNLNDRKNFKQIQAKIEVLK